MKEVSARQNILNKIAQALKKPVPVPFTHAVDGGSTVFNMPAQDLDIEFAENFTLLQGRFSYCANKNELANNLKALLGSRNWSKIYCAETALREMLSLYSFNPGYFNDLATCDAAITGCEFLVARTGTIVMSSAQQSGRTTSVYAPVHICIAYTKQLVADIGDALAHAKEKYKKLPSLITFATGPSRTADIEKTLVVGVHGPKEVFCFLVDDASAV